MQRQVTYPMAYDFTKSRRFQEGSVDASSSLFPPILRGPGRALAGIAILAVLAIGLMLSAVGPLQAQDGPIEYPENGTEPVATFTATDPEGESITWSLETGEDSEDFRIENGVLRFASLPNFEAPVDGDTNNTYTVTVQASAGTSNVPAEQAVTREVTVMVTNVDEPGSIMLSTLQPQVEVTITATLTDPDNPDQSATPLADLTWEWLRGQEVIAGATGATYTPMPGDVGFVLTAKATYKDAEDADNEKTAEIQSAHAVRAKPTTNTPPQYPLIDGSTAQMREVAENTPSGQDIGAPVVATDPGDVLTYSLSGTDAAMFDIDRATGQITTKSALNREATGGVSHTVTVTATDPWGATATSEVTITVTNVDEAPEIARDAVPTRSIAENATTLTLGDAYTATEPEGETIAWSVSGPDSGKFSIAAGQLSFMASPDFEAPGDADEDNVYEVTVVAADPAQNSDELAVRVTVTNEAETGTITFSSLRPKFGIPLTATLDDPDGGVTDVMWQWNDGTDDIEDATSATYTPVVGDIGETLSVTATYRDNSLAAGAAAITLPQAHPATVVADTDNKAPRFPDQDTEMEGRQTDQERTVAERTDARAPTPSGTAIGDPVAAEVDNTLTSAGTAVPDVLTYTLGGTDAASFDIDRATGQLSTKAPLDYETKQSYAVTVTATDPGGLSATVNVTIKVQDINEDPELTGEAPAEYEENGTTPVATFTASDPEGKDIVWTLTGTDEGDFTIVGGVLRFASTPNFEAAADGNTDNTYEFTINASDGTNSATEDVTIEVTNVEEPGTVTLSTLQPQVDVEITATLTDPDGGGTVASPTWMWFRGSSVIVGATTAAYTPESGDVGSVLTAKATYMDAEDTDNDKTAEGRSSHPVRREPSSGNTVPAFPDQNPSTEAVETAQTRMVEENTPSGRNIGAPVRASDPGDVLTYSIDATAETTFDIDRATGQLKTQAPLDTETTASYTVTVTATDPWGATATSEVTITVTNVDEAPSITTTGEAFREITSPEGTTDAPLTLATALADYEATEPETQAMTWSLSGADAARFDIGNQTDGTPSELTFKDQPDFEDPADADTDNVYEVTVVVSDPAGNSDEVAVRVTVTNVAETGTIAFSSLQPKVGIPLTATLDDADGGITNLMWQWNDGTDDIEDATSPTYTPVADDIGDTLTVTASYRDGSLAASADAITLEQAHSATVVADTDNRAPRFPDQDAEMEGRQTDQERSVPENYAAEDTYGVPPVTYPDIGAPVAAEVDNTLAPDGTATADTLTYSLGGTDAASFDIDRSSGQLQAKAALDREDKATYMVTVTATDPGGLSATINVTITVTNVDEPPVILLGGIAISGPISVDYAENGMDAVATYTATGPDAAMAMWSLSGDDAGLFSIGSGGELSFTSSPDYEMPGDADGDNAYSVTVEVTDGTYMNTRDVTVTVVDADDPGTLELSDTQPRVGTELTASVTDQDGITAGSETWQWAREDVGGYTDIPNATSSSYTPVEADEGQHLRVTVSYMDATGPQELQKQSDNPVVAESLLVRYDADEDGYISREEARAAVTDYFDQVISKEEAREVITLYFENPN